ncbi:MAG: lysine--tRNA ligase [Candidatus Beckwithbacteria bacterium]|nr:lysine--tRNA ligase [Candidatus Beckwithbacteria bacterium]
MFWADELADEIIKSGKYKPYHVDDMKTPSGKIHVGALRGVVVHDLIYQALLKRKVKASYSWVFNDMDPMDAFPYYLAPEFKQQMGKPLCQIPSPEPGYQSLAEGYAKQFIKVFNDLGVKPEIIWSSQFYRQGKFNEIIRQALDKVEKIRQLYHEISGYDKPKNWYPYQVICPKCGKIGSTMVTDWDGKMVSFECKKDLVTWATGCGFKGKIEPINANGKLMWKVDWAAHWKVIGVTIEGAGKDHMSKGGSHDLSSVICEQVFNYPSPFAFSYEWFLAKGGAKMSSSKGVGVSAVEISQTLPPEILKFLMVKTNYRRAIIFDPANNETILKLFDDYDATLPHKNLPRFRDVVQYLQDPKIDLKKQFAKANKKELEKRIKYGKIWLDKYAPEEQVFQTTKEIPEFVGTFTNTQREILTKAHIIAIEAKSPEEIQQKIYEEAKTIGLSTSKAFGTIYQATIGKDYGPKAGWLLFNNQQAIKRLDEAAKFKPAEIKSTKTDLIKLSPEFVKKYPSASVGFALIKGVKIGKINTELEKEKQDFLKTVNGLTTEALNQSPEILSYRKMYKQMGVDWHSKRPSPEALLRRIATGKGLYNPINVIVDAYNLIVMKNKVSCGAFDSDKIKFPSVVQIAQGGETALFLGDNQPTVLKPGEVCYFDQLGPYNMDYNYRDATRALATEKTKNVWVNVDGIYEITPDKVQKTVEETIAIIIKYCGGQVLEKGILVANDQTR